MDAFGDTWEPLENLANCKDSIRAFEQADELILPCASPPPPSQVCGGVAPPLSSQAARGQAHFVLVAVRRLAMWYHRAYLRTLCLRPGVVRSWSYRDPANLGTTLHAGGHPAVCCFLRRPLGAAFAIRAFGSRASLPAEPRAGLGCPTSGSGLSVPFALTGSIRP